MKNFRIFGLLIFVILLAVSTGVVYAQDPEPDPEQEPQDEDEGINPVAAYLAEQLGMSVADILALQEDGFGLGNISKAYFLLSQDGSDEITLTLREILVQGQEMGWGNLFKSMGLHPGRGHGLGWMFKELGKKNHPGNGRPEWAGGPPEHANNDKDKSDD
jgi:hypothetical protein